MTARESSICTRVFYLNQATQVLPAAYAGSPLTFVDQVTGKPDTGGFRSKAFRIINDEGGGGGSIFFSFDGINDHGEVKAGESLIFDEFRAQAIFLRGAAGGEDYRFWAW